MKATTWLCPVLTLLCATRIVCTTQREGYPLDYADTNLIQDDYFLEKRNKPSLSIVNPLDVLRQRLLLEIARRQMKENTRQVELNRAILKNVGKRMTDWRHYQRLQRQREQQQEQQYFPMQLDNYMPVTSIFDFIQERHDGSRRGSTLGYDKMQTTLNDAMKSLDTDDATKYQLNGNEIENEITKQMDTSGSGSGTGSAGSTNEIFPNTAFYYNHGRQDRSNAEEVHGKHNEQSSMGYNGNNIGIDVGVNGHSLDNVGESELMNTTNNNDKHGGDGGVGVGQGIGGNSKLHYLYHLHRNHFARK